MNATNLAIVRFMLMKVLVNFAAGLSLVCGVVAQTPPAATSPASSPALPAPPVPVPTDVAPADAVTPVFKPAVRIPRPLTTTPPAVLTNLVFDAEVKEYKAAPDEFDLKFTFAVTNISGTAVVIDGVRTSCGCTTADLPELPWTLEPGKDGSFGINMDLRGKRGSITKSVFVTTDKGNKTIYVRGILPDPAMMTEDQRQRNLALAKADRQAVFKGDCASCHATPAHGKTGRELYTAACGICHESTHRNEMVPDLNVARQARDYEYWRKWIAEGKEGTLMPAFAGTAGGPLTDAQIISLAHFLTRQFPNPPSIPASPRSPNPESGPVTQ